VYGGKIMYGGGRKRQEKEEVEYEGKKSSMETKKVEYEDQ